jgi:hypothetical protein
MKIPDGWVIKKIDWEHGTMQLQSPEVAPEHRDDPGYSIIKKFNTVVFGPNHCIKHWLEKKPKPDNELEVCNFEWNEQRDICEFCNIEKGLPRHIYPDQRCLF